ncbi:hypothetical protein B7463_g3518, partial [Scytalidium lignicola]
MCHSWIKFYKICKHTNSHSEKCKKHIGDRKGSTSFINNLRTCNPKNDSVKINKLCPDCSSHWNYYGISDKEAAQLIRKYRVEKDYHGSVSPHSYHSQKTPVVMADLDGAPSSPQDAVQRAAARELGMRLPDLNETGKNAESRRFDKKFLERKKDLSGFLQKSEGRLRQLLLNENQVPRSRRAVEASGVTSHPRIQYDEETLKKLESRNSLSSTEETSENRNFEQALNSPEHVSQSSHLDLPPPLFQRQHTNDGNSMSGPINSSGNSHRRERSDLQRRDHASKPLPPRPIPEPLSHQPRHPYHALNRLHPVQNREMLHSNKGDKRDEVDLDHFFPPEAYKHLTA